MASIRPYETTLGRRYLVRFRVNGRPQSKGGFARKRDAELFASDLLRRKTLGQLYESRPEELGAYLDAWLERYRLRVRASTHQRRKEALVAVPDKLRRTPLPDLRAADVEDVIVVVGARAPRQAQLALASLKLALRDARKRGQQFDPAILELKPPRSRERQQRFLTWPEVEHLASFLPDSEARLVMVAALTGLRQGELFSLAWGDVDLDERVVRVREGKTAAARRSVDLAPLAAELLKEQAASFSAGGRSERNLAFPAPTGGRWNPTNFMHRRFRPAVKAAGLVGLNFHALRHTYASLMIQAGVNVKAIADQLGHSDGGALVLRRYGHLYAGAGRDAADALERVVRA